MHKAMFAGAALLLGCGNVLAQEPARGCGMRGHVADAAGRGVQQARVELMDDAGRAAAASAVSTDKNGDFCVPPLAFQQRGEAWVLVSAQGYQQQASQPVAVGPGIEAVIDITLAARFSEEVTVSGRGDSLIGSSASASEGSVGLAELKTRPLLRSTDIMEAVPGVAMTQHSTGGHAPIILLRGYNLDHGTDFATFVEGVPLNLPSHAHAQGYSDTNFLITDLIERIDFQKGPYAASVGDFATAGAANIAMPQSLPHPFATVEIGPNAFYRGAGGGSIERGDGQHWLYAGEVSHYDGPSVVSDDFNKAKGLLRYSDGNAREGRSLSVFGYRARWNASDGYPRRAVTNGYITRFGTLDPSDGGATQRYLAIGNWHRATDRALTRVTAYAQYYDFDLFSNLTFNTFDPILGDQIEQAEHRFTTGLLVSQQRAYSWSGRAVTLTGGLQLRHDRNHQELFNTVKRTPSIKYTGNGATLPAQVFDNHINETSVSPYVEAQIQWTRWLKTMTGARGEIFHLGVDSDLPINSGTRNVAVVTPKLGVIFGPWARTELYLNAGSGFHSNHAAGVMQRDNPSAPIVRTRGAEVGMRTTVISNLQSSLALWIIDSDSELIYTPEDGFTVPSRPGRRYGVEWNNFYRVRRWLALDMDAAWSSARYRIDPKHEGRYIEDAIRGVLSAGVAVPELGRFSGSLRGRYLGPRWLVPDGSVSSHSSVIVNADLQIRVGSRVTLGVDLLNLLNRRYDDIEYYFATRIRDPRPGGALESSPQLDYVTHPGEPRTARVRWTVRF
jgi:hypothetical protein